MEQRYRKLNQKSQIAGPVVYWMSRDQRMNDNWALLYAQSEALRMEQPLVVVFCKIPSFLGAGSRHYDFMMEGLGEVARKLKEKMIPLVLLEGEPKNEIPSFLQQIHAGLLVADFNPLRISRRWKEQVEQGIEIAMVEVDAHNVVPCFKASEKQEFGAYTIRPKINKKIFEYMTPFPEVVTHFFENHIAKNLQQKGFRLLDTQMNRIKSVQGVKPGEDAAKQCLKEFIANRIQHYHLRNDPNKDVCSGISPYLHFGHISGQRVALEVQQSGNSAGDFLEELIVRRELSDNFCYYNDKYDHFEGFPNWAKESLNKHREDVRRITYRIDELENAKTHDLLWNAAQMEMVKTGRMHGYLRMYWAKKILEWSTLPEEALHNAIYLNDRYQLDGRDPNGYTGIAWSIGGVHDRAWGERNIFGKIRYMSYDGCKRKFDIAQYIQRMEKL